LHGKVKGRLITCKDPTLPIHNPASPCRQILSPLQTRLSTRLAIRPLTDRQTPKLQRQPGETKYDNGRQHGKAAMKEQQSW
jgi:hypothetical protein